MSYEFNLNWTDSSSSSASSDPAAASSTAMKVFEKCLSVCKRNSSLDISHTNSNSDSSSAGSSPTLKKDSQQSGEQTLKEFKDLRSTTPTFKSTATPTNQQQQTTSPISTGSITTSTIETHFDTPGSGAFTTTGGGGLNRSRIMDSSLTSSNNRPSSLNTAATTVALPGDAEGGALSPLKSNSMIEKPSPRPKEYHFAR